LNGLTSRPHPTTAFPDFLFDFVRYDAPEGDSLVKGHFFTLATVIGIAAQPISTVAQQSARATLDELKQGGFVIVIRHGRTNEGPAFPRDESPTDLSNCAGQTMLTQVGRDQASAIGAAFRNAAVPVGKVLASGLCRAIETGRLAFGRVESSDALLIESFVPIAGASLPAPWPQRVEMMKTMLATVPEAGTNTVLITHFPNIKAALGIQINFGDAAIIKPDGRGGIEVVGKILSREWSSL
jgi:phosphohistidine phosphatase SixA